jgi:anti-repressor protein
MQEIIRGDIFYADLGYGVGSEQCGKRPVVILQNDIGNKYSSTVIVATVTSNLRDFVTHVPIDTECGLKMNSAIALEQIRTIDKSRLYGKTGHVSPEIMEKVEEVLELSFGIETKDKGAEEVDKLIPFNYQEKQVRTIIKDGDPWFVAKDVCDILGISNANMAAARLDDDEVSQTEVTDSLGRDQNTNIISEAGLYTLILRSDKDQAKPFRKWVASEVLPSIRKHGLYATEELLNNPDLAIKAFTALKEEREKNKLLQAENKLLSQQTLTWTSRKVLEAIVKAYGASIKIPDVNGFQEAWKDFKKELLYNYGINLNLRISKQMENSNIKTKPKTLDMIHDDELPRCISTAVALCKAHRVDISEILSKYQKSA